MKWMLMCVAFSSLILQAACAVDRRAIGAADSASEAIAAEPARLGSIPTLQVLPELPRDLTVSDGSRVSGSPISTVDLEAVTPDLQRAASKYPARLLKDMLDGVYVVRGLAINGVPCGGTFSGRTIVINLPDDLTASARKAWLETVFHHEFVECMLRQYHHLFPMDQWVQVLPTGFRYDRALKRNVTPNDLEPSPSLVASGFICRFSQSSIQDDVALIGQYLMSGDPLVWQWAAESAVFGRKVEIIIEFLRRVDPELDHPYCFSLMQRGP